MSKEIIRKEIDHTLETIAEQWEIIRAYESKVPLIEMDIFMGNIRKLYDDLYLLDKINKAPCIDSGRIKSKITREPSTLFEPGSKSKEEIPETREEKPAIIDAEKEAIAEPEAKSNDLPSVPETPESENPELETIETPLPEPEIMQGEIPGKDVEEHFAEAANEEPSASGITPEINETEKEETVTEIKSLKKPVPPPAPDLFGSHQTTLADKFHSDKKSVKDHLAVNENDNSLGSKMQQSNIADLKSVIGINDKFLFINELFKGDLAGYNQAIEKLNTCQTRQEAIDKLEEMREQNNWSDQSSSFLRLYDFLRRRFAD